MRRQLGRLLCIGLLAGWLGPIGAAGAVGMIKVGAVGPLTGPAASGGNNWRRAFELAVKEANDAGGIDIDGTKEKVEFTAEDSQSRPEVGLSAAEKLLTRDNVDILVGDLIHSSVTLAIMEISPSFPKKLFFSSSGVSSDISSKIAANPKKYANFYKFNFKTDDYAATAFGTLTSLIKDGAVKPSAKTIAFVVEDTDFGRILVDNITATFAKDGWSVVDTEIVPIDQSDFYPQISKLKDLNPGVLFSTTTSIPGGIALVKQLKEQKFPAFHFAINYPSQAEFKNNGGPAIDGLLYTPMMFDAVHNSAHKDLAAKLVAAGLPASGESASGYCNGAILLDALKRAGTLKIDKLEAAMAATDFRCAVGRWVFDPTNHSPRIGPDYFSIPAAQFTGAIDQIVWPPALATTTYHVPTN